MFLYLLSRSKFNNLIRSGWHFVKGSLNDIEPFSSFNSIHFCRSVSIQKRIERTVDRMREIERRIEKKKKRRRRKKKGEFLRHAPITVFRALEEIIDIAQ